MERNPDRVPSASLGSKPSTVGRMSPLGSHTIPTYERERAPSAHGVDDSAFVLLLWLLAAAAVLPGAVDLPFMRHAVSTPSQLDSLVGRATFGALGVVAAFTILSRIAGPRPAPVFGALAWMWGVLFLVSWIVGDRDVDVVRSFVLLLVAIALSLCRIELPRLLWHAKVILRVYLVLCLVPLLAAPAYAWFPSTKREWLLGLPQFVGVALHPNALAPMAALAFLLELASGGRRYLRWIFGALALVVLALTQSRAGWVAGVLVLLIVALIPRGRIGPHRTLLILQCVIGVSLVLFLVVSEHESEDITNGRLGLWNAIIDRAGQWWLFGNGSDAFGATSRSADLLAGWAPGNGHNQFFDSFFSGGILALAPLVVLVVVCATSAARPGPQRRIAVAAFAVLFTVMMFEAPLRTAIATGFLPMAVIVLAIVSAHGGRQSEVAVIAKPTRVGGSAL
jgi:O-antigen ligase